MAVNGTIDLNQYDLKNSAAEKNDLKKKFELVKRQARYPNDAAGKNALGAYQANFLFYNTDYGAA